MCGINYILSFIHEINKKRTKYIVISDVQQAVSTLPFICLTLDKRSKHISDIIILMKYFKSTQNVKKKTESFNEMKPHIGELPVLVLYTRRRWKTSRLIPQIKRRAPLIIASNVEKIPSTDVNSTCSILQNDFSLEFLSVSCSAVPCQAVTTGGFSLINLPSVSAKSLAIYTLHAIIINFEPFFITIYAKVFCDCLGLCSVQENVLYISHTYSWRGALMASGRCQQKSQANTHASDFLN